MTRKQAIKKHERIWSKFFANQVKDCKNANEEALEIFTNDLNNFIDELIEHLE